MVSYFKELENPKDYYLDLINTRLYSQQDIDLKTLPLEFFEKYSLLFFKIKNFDLLFEKNSKEKKLYLNSEIDWPDIPLEWAFSDFINGHGLDDYNFSENGIEKLNYLKKQFESAYKADDFIEDFETYFMAIYDQFIYSDNGLDSSKSCIFSYISSAKIMAKCQNKLSEEDELLFAEALDYMKNYKIEIPHKDYEPVKMYLPNAWYITPYNHLYNTMGMIEGHKEANLIYPYDNIKDGKVANPRGYLIEAKRILTSGCVNKITFDHYTNLIYDFSTIYPEAYYQMHYFEKVRYNALHKRTYNPRIVKLIAGIASAQAGLYSFFYNLKNNSCNYYEDLKFVRQFSLDEILIRCCGFHKISSVLEKTITTSCINYEEEFEEYIKRGWHIDFVKPIILNPYTKRVEEYSDECLLIRKVLRD